MIHPLLAAVDCNNTSTFPPSLWDHLTKDDGNGGCAISISDLKDINILLINAIHIALAIAGLVAVAFVVYGGIKYVMSEGDSAKVANAKSTLVNALVGAVIASLAYVVVGFISSKFGA